MDKKRLKDLISKAANSTSPLDSFINTPELVAHYDRNPDAFSIHERSLLEKAPKNQDGSTKFHTLQRWVASSREI